jgi:hypothetical protein
MRRRIAGVLVLFLILPVFMVMAVAELLHVFWHWLRTGEDGTDIILGNRPFNWLIDLPARAGGWKQ